MKRPVRAGWKPWLLLAALVALAPLGLILPARLGGGPAWGEWTPDQVARALGQVPPGMRQSAGLWRAPLPLYGFKGWDRLGLGWQSLAYLVSAAVGVVVVAGVVLALGRLFLKER